MVEATHPILAAATIMGLATWATGRLVPLPGPLAVQLVMLILEGVALYLLALLAIDRSLVVLLVQRLRATLRRGDVTD
jgi:hypothetical protein